MNAYTLVLLLGGATAFCPSGERSNADAPALPSLEPAFIGGFWLQPVPGDLDEAVLRQAVAGRGAPEMALAELDALATRAAGSEAAGLAQIATGLLLIDAGRPVEAIPHLQHRDVRHTAVRDYASFALGRALEATQNLDGAAQAYQEAVDQASPGPLPCAALFAAAGALGRGTHHDQAAALLQRALTSCPGQEPTALLRLGTVQEARHDERAAAAAYDRLDQEYPDSAQAIEAAPRLRALAPYLPPAAPATQIEREIQKALAFFESDRDAEAATRFRALLKRPLDPEDADLVHVRLGRALLALDRTREATAQLGAVRAGGAFGAEAAYHLARVKLSRLRRTDGLETVASRWPATSWAEEALLTLAHHHHKDGRLAEALPYYRRLVEQFPEGRYADRALWWIGWDAYLAGRHDEAATTLQKIGRLKGRSSYTPGSLYWAGRARREQGQEDQARQLFGETVLRFKHTYHGLKAQQALGEPAGEVLPSPGAVELSAGDPRHEVPEPQLTRIRQLLLIERHDEAEQELRALLPSPRVQATLAWLQWRRGRLRPAITAMRRAYPEYVGQMGDRLPEPVWRILYPLEFSDLLQLKSREEHLDPALVAALIWQESTFDPSAVSVAGARGLMQLVPRTGRALARRLGIKYRENVLHDPEIGLELGTYYFRQVLNSFGGRLERALAAYNAGPGRVSTWSSARPGAPAEQFIESIPYPETRSYVTSILSNREHYRRLYRLSDAPAAEAENTALP
ncbi:MAG TPA: transglycosylase SLT domain-containing protein [Vicinamibacteria bacterium]|nr:transglycosylase SLT domain-containing protein [Vicinamibacteria bacterium]